MRTDLRIIPYEHNRKTDWNEVVANSINGTFLIDREYLDYHEHRFTDASFIVYKGSNPVAVFPGNLVSNHFYSHQGLTYGGLVYTRDVKYSEIAQILDGIISILASYSVEEITIRTIPSIYHKILTEDQLFYYYDRGFLLIRRLLSSTIDMNSETKYNLSRKRGVRKGYQLQLEVITDQNWDDYWTILEKNLNIRHNVRPVHSLEEILHLKSFFPTNIKLFTVQRAGIILAGVVLYITDRVVHSQYAASTANGRNCGALDFVYDYCINKYRLSHNYFDFGHSNEENGKILNTNLLYQKEGFGAKACTYDTYYLKKEPKQ